MLFGLVRLGGSAWERRDLHQSLRRKRSARLSIEVIRSHRFPLGWGCQRIAFQMGESDMLEAKSEILKLRAQLRRTEEERRHPKKSRAVLCQRARVKVPLH